jgi:hypothetical protein
MSIPRNLGNFAYNVDTSGQVSLTTGVTGTLPVANGGTGSTSTTFVNAATNVTGTLPVANGGTGAATLTANNVLLGNGTSALQAVAPGSNGNILTSNGTTWVSSTPAGGGVTSLNGQTGAITNTTLGNIGSVLIAIMYKTSTGLISGETIAGSSLYYPTSVASWMTRPQDSATLQSLSAGQGMFITPSATTAQRISNGNTGLQVPSGNVTTLSGTWRCMSSIVGPSYTSRIACDTQTQSTYGQGLFVRVS